MASRLGSTSSPGRLSLALGAAKAPKVREKRPGDEVGLGWKNKTKEMYY